MKNTLRSPNVFGLPTQDNSARNIEREMSRSETIVQIPEKDIIYSPLNPRKNIDEKEIKELADSIKIHGVVQPVTVRRSLANLMQFEIVMGERRVRGSRLAGKTHIPAVIWTIDDATFLEIALIENIQRAGLDVIEEANGYKAMLAYYTQDEIAKKVGKSQSVIANALRLLQLPDDVQKLIQTNQLTTAHGKVLAKWKEFPEFTSQLAHQVLERKIPSKELEKGLPWQVSIQENEYIVKMTDYGDNKTLFDFKTVCSGCSFKAYVKGSSYGNDLCLKPAHHKELQAEAEEKLKIVNPEFINPATGETYPLLKSLGAQEIETIWNGDGPEGCGEHCSCRSKALNGNTNLIDICLDPKKFNVLKEAQQKRIQEERQDFIEEHYGELLVEMAAFTGHRIPQRAVALIASDYLSGYGNDRVKAIREAAEDLCLDFNAKLFDTSNGYTTGDDIKRRNYLLQFTPEQLIKLMFLSRMKESFNSFKKHGSMSKNYEWYTGALDKEEAETESRKNSLSKLLPEKF